MLEREENEERLQELLDYLEEKGPKTRPEIVSDLGIPRTTVYDRLVRLVLRGQVRKFPVPRKTRGRPRIKYGATSEGG